MAYTYYRDVNAESVARYTYGAGEYVLKYRTAYYLQIRYYKPFVGTNRDGYLKKCRKIIAWKYC